LEFALKGEKMDHSLQRSEGEKTKHDRLLFIALTGIAFDALFDALFKTAQIFIF
jgi:hypothetical protein